MISLGKWGEYYLAKSLARVWPWFHTDTPRKRRLLVSSVSSGSSIKTLELSAESGNKLVKGHDKKTATITFSVASSKALEAFKKSTGDNDPDKVEVNALALDGVAKLPRAEDPAGTPRDAPESQPSVRLVQASLSPCMRLAM